MRIVGHLTRYAQRRALGLPSLRMPECRYMMRRGGRTPGECSGTAWSRDTKMVVRVYGRYKPSAEERREWEAIAAAQDAARARGV